MVITSARIDNIFISKISDYKHKMREKDGGRKGEGGGQTDRQRERH